MPLIKIVNGVPVEMTPQEEADHIASLQPTLAQAKAQARQKISARAKQESDEDRLLDQANAAARVQAVRQNARQLWQAVQAANTVAAVAAVDLDAGW